MDIVHKDVLVFLIKRYTHFSIKSTPQHTPKSTFRGQTPQIFYAPRFARRSASPSLGRERDNQTRPNLWGPSKPLTPWSSHVRPWGARLFKMLHMYICNTHMEEFLQKKILSKVPFLWVPKISTSASNHASWPSQFRNSKAGLGVTLSLCPYGRWRDIAWYFLKARFFLWRFPSPFLKTRSSSRF